MISVRPSYDSYLDEYYGLSSDVKPSSDSVVNGSTFVEIDTNKKYRYDAENKVWHERAASGNTTPVNSTVVISSSWSTYQENGMPDISLDVKAGELFELLQSKRVIVHFEEPNSLTEAYNTISTAQQTQFNSETTFFFYSSIFPIPFVAYGENEYPSLDDQDGSGNDPGAPAVPGNPGEHIAQ